MAPKTAEKKNQNKKAQNTNKDKKVNILLISFYPGFLTFKLLHRMM